MMMRVSLIRPSTRRSITIPQTRTGRPVAVPDSPLWVPVHLKRADDFIVFRNLLLDGEDNIGKTGPHGADDVFQAVKSRTLAGQRNLLNHILPGVLRCRLDVSFATALSTKLRTIVALSCPISSPLNLAVRP